MIPYRILTTYVGRVLSALWGVGSFHSRVAIAVLVAVPVLIVLASLIDSQVFVAFIVVTMILAIATLAAWRLNPLVIATIAATPFGQEGMRAIKRIIAFELFIGLYAMVVPTGGHPVWVAIVFVDGLFLATASLAWDTNHGGHRMMVSAAKVVLAFVTLAFFFPEPFSETGGRRKAWSKALGADIKANGFWNAVTPSWPTSSAAVIQAPAARTANASAGVTSLDNPPDYPICDDASGTINLNFGSDGGGETPLRTNCWSKKFKVVPNENFIIRTDNPSDNGHQYRFANGEVMTFGSDGASDSSRAGRSIFRLRGIRGNGHATVTIRRQ